MAYPWKQAKAVSRECLGGKLVITIANTTTPSEVYADLNLPPGAWIVQGTFSISGTDQDCILKVRPYANPEQDAVNATEYQLALCGTSTSGTNITETSTSIHTGQNFSIFPHGDASAPYILGLNGLKVTVLTSATSGTAWVQYRAVSI